MLASCEAGPETGTPAAQNNSSVASQTGTPSSTAINAQLQVNQPAAGTMQTRLTQQLPIVRSQADLAAYQGAVQLKDVSYCDKIAIETIKKECQTAVADEIALADAIAKLDPTLCSKLSTQDQQEACKTQVEVITTEKKQSESQQANQNEIVNQYETITKAGDYTKCKTINDTSYSMTCELTILTNMALIAKDPSICDKASSQAVTDECKKRVGGVQ